MINALYFDKICSIYSLNKDDYIVKKKEKCVVNREVSELRNLQGLERDVAFIRVKTDAMCIEIHEISGKIDKLTEYMSSLGRIDLESIEYLKKIADGIKTMNDKYNKPSAYLRK